MENINELCAQINFKERELRRLNGWIKYMEGYKGRHEGTFEIDISDYYKIRTRLQKEVQEILHKLESA